MDQHIRTVHNEYASPSRPEGVPFPATLWDEMKVTPEEEEALGIPATRVRPTFTCIARQESMAMDVAEAGTAKQKISKSNKPGAGPPPAKRPRIAEGTSRRGRG